MLVLSLCLSPFLSGYRAEHLPGGDLDPEEVHPLFGDLSLYG